MADTFLFPANNRIQRGNQMLDATLRDFSGGWNVVDNDLNLDNKFAKVLQNMQLGIDGANEVRPGTVLFAETNEYLDTIVNCEYYSGHIIAVGKNGKLVKIDATGKVNEIWSDAWANNLDGSPDGWTTTTFASFAVFNGDLIVCNGVNKPLIINSSINVEYLKDLATNTNANTPIARFVVAHGRYLVMAGDLTAGTEDKLYISATDVSGTWVGDSAPNDAVNLNLGSRVPSGSFAIKGLGRFRDKLMVTFADAVLPGTLGTFTEDVHTPTFDDAMEGVGSLSHRVIQTVGEDILFGDVNGISSIKRALFTGSTQSTRNSQLIDPEYHKVLDQLDSTVAIEDNVWSIWDSANTNYMFFIPNGSTDELTTEYRCFVYKKNPALKIDSWSDWRNWNFKSGCRSALKHLFLTTGTQVYRLGEATHNQIYTDYQGDQEMFSDDTTFLDNTGFNPVANEADSGVPIQFIWELPWSDNNDRFKTKNSRYINFDTQGDNKFLVEMFTDNIYKDKTDFGEDWEEDSLKFDDFTGWDVDVLDPTLSMVFEGGDSPGFGSDEFGEDFGGGRPTRLEKLYAWTAKYKIQKLRLSGDAVNQLKVISVSLAYLGGSVRR
tara:strand:- start:1929 stop:3743 length:1815 start_codon:yes stop_codon:yes gene_type:complete